MNILKLFNIVIVENIIWLWSLVIKIIFKSFLFKNILK
jgi:hypothetical protein